MEQISMDMGPPNRGPGSMTWNCNSQGCFVDKSPNIGLFGDCLPDRISPTNIDFFIELEGYFLYGEFKKPGAKMKDGQRRAFLALSRQPQTTFFLVEMKCPSTVLRWRVFHAGQELPWVVGDIDMLKDKIRKWAFRVAPHRCAGVPLGHTY